MMPAASHQRTVGISVAFGVLAVALSGCGNVTSVGTDASAGHAGGGASGVAGAGGAGGATGAGGTSGARGAGGATGTGGVGATGVAGTDGTDAKVSGGGAGVAGGGGAGRGGTTGGGGAGRGGTTGVGGSAAAREAAAQGAAGPAARQAPATAGAAGRAARTIAPWSACQVGRMCCDGACANVQNNPFNCGTCGKVCQSDTPFCYAGTCQKPQCSVTTDICAPDTICCETAAAAPASSAATSRDQWSRIAPVCFTPTGSDHLPAGLRAPLRERSQSEEEHRARRHGRDPGKVGALPISTWSYINEPATSATWDRWRRTSARASGSAATIARFHSVDAHGVALAAIQALERMVAAQEKRIANLERENRRLERRLRPNDSRPSAR